MRRGRSNRTPSSCRRRLASIRALGATFTAFDWVLPSFTGFYWVSLGCIGFYWVLLGFTGFHWVVLSRSNRLGRTMRATTAALPTRGGKMTRHRIGLFFSFLFFSFLFSRGGDDRNDACRPHRAARLKKKFLISQGGSFFVVSLSLESGSKPLGSSSLLQISK